MRHYGNAHLYLRSNSKAEPRKVPARGCGNERVNLQRVRGQCIAGRGLARIEAIEEPPLALLGHVPWVKESGTT